MAVRISDCKMNGERYNFSPHFKLALSNIACNVSKVNSFLLSKRNAPVGSVCLLIII